MGRLGWGLLDGSEVSQGRVLAFAQGVRYLLLYLELDSLPLLVLLLLNLAVYLEC